MSDAPPEPEPRVWSAFPHPGEFRFDADEVARQWSRLHAGDAEPCPDDAALLTGWAHFHNGEFQRAAEAGTALGEAGLTLNHTATALYANYLERNERTRLELLLRVAARAEAQTRAQPQYAGGWYWQAYALGRYSLGISVAKALAQGMGTKIKAALERAIRLEPRHADAHLGLGVFHAEVIDKVGALIGGMTYGARRDVGLRHFGEAMQLHPQSPWHLIEYANGLVMLEGDRVIEQATRLYEQAAASVPADARERLDIDMARVELSQ